MIYTKVFPCGIKFAFKRSRSLVAYSSLTIKSGTRNEPQRFPGMAHMTEHMLFKGTAKRTPQEISNRLELLGGDLNAYTTKEETAVYSTVLKEDLSKAVDLLFELAFTSVFPQGELEKERNVVIDEINMYKDSPSESIFDDFEEYLFADHLLSRSVLGNVKGLKKIKSSDICSYVRENFTPDNMCISIVAGITPQKAEKIVLSAIEKYVPQSFRPAERPCPVLEGGSLSAGVTFRKEVNRKDHQANCIVGTTAFSFYDEDRLTLILLNNILGGPGSNSLLNQELREKNALVYNVDSIFTQYADTGTFLITFGCEKHNLQKCLDLIGEQLSALRGAALPEKKVKEARKQLLGQLAIASDSGEAQSLSMGKSMLVFGRIMPDEEVRARINAITSEQLLRVARKVLASERLSVLIYK